MLMQSQTRVHRLSIHTDPQTATLSQKMDSQVRRDGRLVLLVDKNWRDDVLNLPHEEIAVPVMELPDPEPDTGNPHETLKEQELKWTDLALSRITAADNPVATTASS